MTGDGYFIECQAFFYTPIPHLGFHSQREKTYFFGRFDSDGEIIESIVIH